MVRTVLLALAAVTITACATPTDLRTRTPDLDLVSSKSAKHVAVCIAETWEGNSPLGTTPVTMRESMSGYVVHMICLTNTCLLADVLATPEGSRTVMYANAPARTGSYMEHARSCQ